jgi:hypothetical protein
MTRAAGRGTAGRPAGGHDRAPVLLSVNVGMPKDVAWRGKTVHTGVWKHPVAGAGRTRFATCWPVPAVTAPPQPGTDPERRDYASVAHVADLDGNTWMIQEIGYRRSPGGHDGQPRTDCRNATNALPGPGRLDGCGCVRPFAPEGSVMARHLLIGGGELLT